MMQSWLDHQKEKTVDISCRNPNTIIVNISVGHNYILFHLGYQKDSLSKILYTSVATLSQ